MGPRLFGFTKGETTYSFRLIPIGGYCAMEGEDEDSDNPRAFNNAKIWKRMIIIIAGATMNILLGLVFMMISLLPQNSFASTKVADFSAVSYTSVAGLRRGDQIVKIDGYDVNTYTDLSFAIFLIPVNEVDGSDLTLYKEDCLYGLFTNAQSLLTEHRDQYDDETAQIIVNTLNSYLYSIQSDLYAAADQQAAYQVFCSYYDKVCKTLGIEAVEYPSIGSDEKRQVYRADVTVIRDGERVLIPDVDFMATEMKGSDTPKGSIDFSVQGIEKNFGTVITHTFSDTVSNVRMVWGSLAGLVTGKFSFKEMSGPIGIASALSTVASDTLESSGFGSAVMSIIYVMMIISVNLGIINMLPFPALDGGRFLLLLIEAIFKKPIPRKVEKYINAVGLILLLGLSVVVAINDIIKLVS